MNAKTNSCIDELRFIERSLVRSGGIAEENMAKGIAKAIDVIRQLEAERDAAVDDIEQIAKDYGVCFCDYCKYGDDEEECAKRNCNGHRNDFEWRGVQEVER